MKYAIVDNGNNQLIVKEGDKVLVNDQGLEEGKNYTWKNVLFLRNGDDIGIGTPHIKGAEVTGIIGTEVKGPKVINFKKKRRKGYKRKVGHRQKYTEITIKEIK
ncbi:MAG: 50S ribosomal protein L21 [Elusimicrobiota bacterium]